MRARRSSRSKRKAVKRERVCPNLRHYHQTLIVEGEDSTELKNGGIYGKTSAVSFHSYRSASTGSSFEARSAGTKPLTTPTASNTRVESMTVASEICRWISAVPESSSK